MTMTTIRLIAMVALYVAASASTTYANIFFACESRQQCDWDPKTEAFDICGDVLDYPSLFELDDGGRLFTHTIATMSSTYYIKSSEYRDSDSILVLTAVSDVGNTYTYAFSAVNKRVAAAGESGDGTRYMVLFVAKSVHK